MNRDDIIAARARIGAQIMRTPLAESRTLSRITGAHVFLKFENLQFTASFKERGALNCLLCLSEAERCRGVIAMSAGNHAQALAYHAERLGIPARIVMPRHTPNIKVAQTRMFGAEVELFGNVFEETRRHTETLAKELDITLVHPFDDLRVIAGQGTLGLEILEQLPEVDTIVAPIGGGGLIGGVALAVKSTRPDVRVIGVQVERFAGAWRAFHDSGRSSDARPAEPAGSAAGTVAEGIAVKHPGGLTLPLLERWVDDVLLVGEQQVEQAIFQLLEIEKTVVEGAGAVPLAAVTAHPELFAGRNVVLILSGGNIDMMILSSVVQRGLFRSHRLVQLRVEVPDVPGGLADLTRLLADLDSNIVDIQHERMFESSSVRATRVELMLQLRGEEQTEQILDALRARGYEAELPD
jgi:threonine dehydratase